MWNGLENELKDEKNLNSSNIALALSLSSGIIDIITISETWLKNPKRWNRWLQSVPTWSTPQSWRWAGFAPNVRKDLKTTLRFKRTFFYYWGKLSRAVDGEVQYEKLKSIVICVTLSAPTTVHALIFFVDAFSSWLSHITHAFVLDKPIIILGDLNCDSLKENAVRRRVLKTFLAESNLEEGHWPHLILVGSHLS